MVRIVDGIDTTDGKAVYNGTVGLSRGRTLADLTWRGIEWPDRVDLTVVKAAWRCDKIWPLTVRKIAAIRQRLCIVRDTILFVCQGSVEGIDCLSFVIVPLRCCIDMHLLQYKQMYGSDYNSTWQILDWFQIWCGSVLRLRALAIFRFIEKNGSIKRYK